MADIQKGELQDNLGNTIYPHTESEIVFCPDGETVQEKLLKTEGVLGESNGTTGSLEINDSKKLVTSDATYQLAQNQGDCKLSYEGGEFYIQAGADTASKKKLGSGGKIYKLGTGRSFNISSIVGSENVGKYGLSNFLAVWNCPTGSTPVGGGSIEDDYSFSYANAGNPTLSYDNATGIITSTNGVMRTSFTRTSGAAGSVTIQVSPTIYFLDGAELISV